MFGQIITLLSLIACIGLNVPFNFEKTIKYDEVVTTESIKQRNYQHTDWLNSFTEVVYKYESNEVNSFDDLIVGNIYKIDLTGYSSTTYRNILYTSFAAFTFNQQVQIISTNETPDMVYTHSTDDQNALVMYSGSQYRNFFIDVLIFKYDRPNVGYLNEFIQYVSYTDFNIIESVTYHEPQTVVGVINEFCENYLFSEIPFAQSMTFEIGGQSINLMTWLVMLVGIALSVGILILLFVVFKWLFLLFAGIFKR